MSASDRLFRALLRAYPRDFRREYGWEMEQLFRDQRRALHGTGRGGVLHLWTSLLLDTLRAAPREHAAGLAHRLLPFPLLPSAPMHRIRLATALLLLAIALHGLVAAAVQPSTSPESWLLTALTGLAGGALLARARHTGSATPP